MQQQNSCIQQKRYMQQKIHVHNKKYMYAMEYIYGQKTLPCARKIYKRQYIQQYIFTHTVLVRAIYWCAIYIVDAKKYVPYFFYIVALQNSFGQGNLVWILACFNPLPSVRHNVLLNERTHR